MLECRIWPGHTYYMHVFKEGEDICLKEYSFKKDQDMTIRNHHPFLIAPSDGRYLD